MRDRRGQVEAGYAVAHITLLGVGLYVDVALTQWNGVFWTALQNHQSKQFYRVLAAIRLGPRHSQRLALSPSHILAHTFLLTLLTTDFMLSCRLTLGFRDHHWCDGLCWDLQ